LRVLSLPSLFLVAISKSKSSQSAAAINDGGFA
jgi:hypothetical protein